MREAGGSQGRPYGLRGWRRRAAQWLAPTGYVVGAGGRLTGARRHRPPVVPAQYPAYSPLAEAIAQMKRGGVMLQ